MTSEPAPSPPVVGLVRLPHGEGLALPAYETAGAAGMDLRAANAADDAIVLAPGERRLIPTGLVFEIPAGFEAQIRPRSGLALKHGITCLNTPGTIDSDYSRRSPGAAGQSGTGGVHRGARLAHRPDGRRSGGAGAAGGADPGGANRARRRRLRLDRATLEYSSTERRFAASLQNSVPDVDAVGNFFLGNSSNSASWVWHWGHRGTRFAGRNPTGGEIPSPQSGADHGPNIAAPPDAGAFSHRSPRPSATRPSCGSTGSRPRMGSRRSSLASWSSSTRSPASRTASAWR